MRNVTIANLEMACWIARLGSFTAAAERLYTTQPAVSARVKDLEESLQLKLFERHTRGVELTIEGREFLNGVEPLLRQIEDLAFATSKSTAGGIVRLGTSSICLDIVASLAKFTRSSLPNVSYQITLGRAARLLEQLEALKLDIAIVAGPVDEHRFYSKGLGVDEMSWVIAASLWERHRTDDIKLLFTQLPIWCVNHDSFYWNTATRSLKPYGVQLRHVNELSNTLAVAKIISEGGGIGLLSRSVVADALEKGRLITVPHLPACGEVEFRIACRRDKAANSIVTTVMEATVNLSQLRDSALPDLGTATNA